MQVNIRKATINDVYGIAKVHVDSWNNAYKNIIPSEYLKSRTYKRQEESWLNRYFNNNETKEFLYVAETINNEIVGIACGTSRNEDINYKGNISVLYILDNYQRQGIGKKMVRTLIERMIGDGVNSLVIWAFGENPYSEFYKKIGGEKSFSKIVNKGGKELIEIGFTWTNLKQLLGELN